MSASVVGLREWGVDLDDEGNRKYMADWLVRTSNVEDDPSIVLNATGLPTVGTTWAFGFGIDLWAWCRPNWKVTMINPGEIGDLWSVRQEFGTSTTSTRCQNATIQNPMSEPDRLGGNFARFQKEVTRDRNGDPILSSSHEILKGIQRDDSRPTVTIEKNVASLGLGTWRVMCNTVNNATLWGLPPRTIKLSNVSWRRLLYGTCTYYYQVTYEFEVRTESWDDTYQDRGQLVLVKGGDPSNPKHFRRATDDFTNEFKDFVVLDGAGKEWEGVGSPGSITPEVYGESNFLLLGIPSSL